jgi:glycosyltransferase involved in cell wall biosynthesis
VQFVTKGKDLSNKFKLTVILAGAASDAEYTQQVRQELLDAFPTAIVIDRFVSPQELAAVLAHTILNFHPPANDADGMTVVEAAAFGAPSVLAGSSIGAFLLLGVDGCLPVSMPEDEHGLPQESLNNFFNFFKMIRTKSGKECQPPLEIEQ